MKKVLAITAVNALLLLAYAPVATADWTDNEERQQTMHEHWQRGSDWRPAIRDRMISIRKDIHEGVESGQLTRREADRARNELESIRDELDRMKSDGYLDGRERHRVLAQLDDVSRHVWRLKHNDRTAGR